MSKPDTHTMKPNGISPEAGAPQVPNPSSGRNPPSHHHSGLDRSAVSRKPAEPFESRSANVVQLPLPTIPPKKSSVSAELLDLLGHRESCIRLSRAGHIVACDCHTKSIDDPALAVGLALHFGRICLARKNPLPGAIIDLLARRVAEGDATCIMVAQWLTMSGLLDMAHLLRFQKRRVS